MTYLLKLYGKILFLGHWKNYIRGLNFNRLYKIRHKTVNEDNAAFTNRLSNLQMVNISYTDNILKYQRKKYY